ncbi:MAG: LPXTG cell wall anchor domain-containing protein [Humibacter sp.]
MRQDVGGLAATGSNVTPWLIVAGIIVLLGVIALVVAGIVRSRRSEQQVEDAAETVADAGGTLPTPDPNAPASDETVIEEAAELGGAAAAGTAAATGADAAKAETAAPFSGDPAEIAPSDEFAPNVGQIGQDLDAPADTSWPADGESQPGEPGAPRHSASPEKEVPPFDAPTENDDPSK